MIEGDRAAKKAFNRYPIDFSHIDVPEIQTEKRKLYSFVAADRASNYAFARLKAKATGVAPESSSTSS
jgi:hypothetical protein